MTPPITAPRGFRGAFRIDPAARACYSEGAGPYRIVPDAIAIPLDVDDLLTLVRAATDHGWPLVPRGAGSGMPGGNVGRGIVVDLMRFDTAPSQPTSDTVRVGAAVRWSELDAALQVHGRRLPPEPSSGAFCTLGGMIAANAAGARSVRYGSIRPWVLGVELVSGRGERLWLERGARPAPVPEWIEALEEPLRAAAALIRRRFPQTRKNASGYALDRYLDSGELLDLVIGSEGTLGIVTRALLRVDRPPAAAAGVLLGLGDDADLGEVVQRLLPHEPSALELLDATYLRMAQDRARIPDRSVEAVLLLDFEGDSAAAVTRAARAAAAAVADVCAFAEPALTPEAHREVWHVRHAASPALASLPDTRRSLQIVEDGCVPIPHLGRYVRGVRAIADDLGILIVAFGHAGDGHLHVNALVDTTEPDVARRLGDLYDRVADLVIQLGGTPSGEHGDGRLRAPIVERLYGPDVVTLFRRIKAAFDPAGIMNPGVILPAANARPIAELKVGPDAAPIPAAAADALRALERAGAWATPKLDLLAEPDAH
ncbi:MAG: FAD-binding oxidoreductase [Gemmatimonadales bacterium]|jgi:FAD/FMN-containing dehydrogenase